MFHAECEWFTLKCVYNHYRIRLLAVVLFQFLSKDQYNYAYYLLGLKFTISFRIFSRIRVEC